MTVSYKSKNKSVKKSTRSSKSSKKNIRKNKKTRKNMRSLHGGVVWPWKTKDKKEIPQKETNPKTPEIKEIPGTNKASEETKLITFENLEVGKYYKQINSEDIGKYVKKTNNPGYSSPHYTQKPFDLYTFIPKKNNYLEGNNSQKNFQEYQLKQIREYTADEIKDYENFKEEEIEKQKVKDEIKKDMLTCITNGKPDDKSIFEFITNTDNNDEHFEVIKTKTNTRAQYYKLKNCDFGNLSIKIAFGRDDADIFGTFSKLNENNMPEDNTEWIFLVND
jgi:hypothetical protein